MAVILSYRKEPFQGPLISSPSILQGSNVPIQPCHPCPCGTAWPQSHLPELLDLLRSDAGLDVPSLLLSGRGYGLLVHTLGRTLEAGPLEGRFTECFLWGYYANLVKVISASSTVTIRYRVCLTWRVHPGVGCGGSQLCKSIPAAAEFSCAPQTSHAGLQFIKTSHIHTATDVAWTAGFGSAFVSETWPPCSGSGSKNLLAAR